jgi:hypothetical protein
MLLLSRVRCVTVRAVFYCLNILCVIVLQLFIGYHIFKMSKLTRTELIDLLDGNISEPSDIESDTVSVEKIEEILANFDESENFELPDYNEIEN